MTPFPVLGAMSFGDTVEKGAAREILAVALESGVAEVDTAVTYAGGRSETMLGELLGDGADGVRVSSKVGMQEPERGGPLSATEVLRCARLSADRLGRALDTLYLHQPDRTTTLSETADGLAAALDEGLACRIGVSNHASWQHVELTAALVSRGLAVRPRAQQLYNALARDLEVEFVPFSRERSVEVVVYNPLAGGLLSGRYGSGSQPTVGRFATSAVAGLYRGRYFTPEHLAVVDELAALATAHGLGLAEMALRWCIGREGVDGVLLGASTPEQLRANLGALSHGPLDAELAGAMDAHTAAARELAPRYAR